MKINTLRLENFQGIKAATFDFKGQSASVYGDNATGKTTLSAPVIKCKKTPRKKCRFVAEEAKKR